MADETAYPFHSFSFSLIEGARMRAAMRMKLKDDGMYELHVERGSAANPTSQFTRAIPLDTVQKLRDSLQNIGVFGWDESYDDLPDLPSRRWILNIVFREDVFAMGSRGGNDVPVGFELMLEELYQLDFPRPDGAKAASPADAGKASSDAGLGGMGAVGSGTAGFGLGDSPFGNVGLGTALNSMGSMGFGGVGGMSIGDLGAYGAMGKGGLGGVDFSELSKLGDSAAGAEMAELMKEMQSNPQAMQQRMRDEYAHMSPEERGKMLDMLASMGFASRAWWERFLRGF